MSCTSLVVRFKLVYGRTDARNLHCYCTNGRHRAATAVLAAAVRRVHRRIAQQLPLTAAPLLLLILPLTLLLILVLLLLVLLFRLMKLLLLVIAAQRQRRQRH
jgi:cytochrome c-type biogenesis protein CcmH/NrfF